MLLWGVTMVSPATFPHVLIVDAPFAEIAQGLVKDYGQLLGEIHRARRTSGS